MHLPNPLATLEKILSGFAAHWPLIKAMSVREIAGRYRGSLFGLAWSFFNPILMLGIYTFFFSVVIKSRWGGPQSQGTDVNIAVILFAGLIIHGFFSEIMVRSPSLVTGNVNFVKKVVFPLEIFPWVALLESLFHMLISIGVLLAMMLISGEAWHWEMLLFPAILLPLAIMALGFAWALAALGVYFRDIAQITGFVASTLLFLSPIFYPLSALPQSLQNLAMLNPLTIVVEQFRAVLIYGLLPDLGLMSAYTSFAIIVLIGGYTIFMKLRRGFADVL
jgi:lipopolysaccharide transport system permease protein